MKHIFIFGFILFLVSTTFADHTEVSRTYLIGFKKTTNVTGIDRLNAVGITSANDGEIEPLGIYKVRILPTQAETVRMNPIVEFVEPDQLHEPDATPNDPRYLEEWHLPKIGAPTAWDVTRSSPDVIVAIVDSGADPTHPDLVSKLVPGRNVRDENDDTTDTSGHGTKVCGAAGAATDNAVGIAAIGWRVSVMPIKAAEPSGSAFTSNLAKGIIYGADHGAFAINASFSGMHTSSTIRSAAQYARSHGAIFVASAGNCGCDDPTPENPDVFSVGATTSNDTAASFTSRGAFVDVSAPGSSILTTSMGGTYSVVSGTSFAAPITAGTLALMRLTFPLFTPDQYIERLENTADDLGETGHDPVFGAGRIRADRAVGLTVPPTPTPTRTPTKTPTITPTRTPTPLICGLPLLPLCPTPTAIPPTRTATAQPTATRTPTHTVPSPTPTKRGKRWGHYR